MHIRYNETNKYFEKKVSDSPETWAQLDLTGQTNIPVDMSEAWPVGSIFISTSATNPATLLGFGTWAAFGTGRVLVGKDSGQTEFDTIEETGGAKTVTLGVNEMPQHNHGGAHSVSVTDNRTWQLNYQAGSYGVTNGGSNLNQMWNGGGYTPTPIQVNGSAPTGSVTVANQGGGGAHNNLQPYIVVNMWKRTA